jgi:hypothetical protein
MDQEANVVGKSHTYAQTDMFHIYVFINLTHNETSCDSRTLFLKEMNFILPAVTFNLLNSYWKYLIMCITFMENGNPYYPILKKIKFDS